MQRTISPVFAIIKQDVPEMTYLGNIWLKVLKPQQPEQQGFLFFAPCFRPNFFLFLPISIMVGRFMQDHKVYQGVKNLGSDQTGSNWLCSQIYPSSHSIPCPKRAVGEPLGRLSFLMKSEVLSQDWGKAES